MKFITGARILVILLFANALTLSAQIGGRVIDGKTNVPLSGVHIYLQKDSTTLEVTDRNGRFDTLQLSKLPPGDTLVFSYIGYQHIKHSRKDLSTREYQIRLFEDTQRLGEVTVTANKRSYFLNCVSLASMPKDLFSFGSFLHDGKIYVVAGDESSVLYNDNLTLFAAGGIIANLYHSPNLLEYDIAGDKWTIHENIFTPRACHAAHLYKNKIYVIGGKNNSTNRKREYTDATMEVYDIEKDTLYVDPVNPHQAVNFTSFIYNDCLYMIGGSVKKKVYSSKIHALDLRTGIWYEMGDIPKEFQREMIGIRVGHLVYFFGGRRNNILMRQIDTYNLLTGEWKHIGELSEEMGYPGLACNGNEIYINGGAELHIYNVSTNSVTAYPMPEMSAQDATNDSIGVLEDAGLFFWEGKLYIVGGRIFNRTLSGLTYSPSGGVYSIDVGQIGAE